MFQFPLHKVYEAKTGKKVGGVEFHAPPSISQLGQLTYGVSKIKGTLTKLGLLVQKKTMAIPRTK
jgi:hypothetical protein